MQQNGYFILTFILGFKTPNEVELEKLNELFHTTGEIRCPRRLTSFES